MQNTNLAGAGACVLKCKESPGCTSAENQESQRVKDHGGCRTWAGMVFSFCMG